MEAFIVTFRESLEAAIIVGILLAVLSACNAQQFKRFVWAGIAFGILGSIVFAWVFSVVSGGFSGTNEKIYEGVLMLTAAGFITHMVFWMKAQAEVLKKNITTEVENSLMKGTGVSLFFISFFSVVREGLETVIFFQAIDAQSNAGISVWGGILGVVSAIVLAVGLQKFAKKVSYKKFFQMTGALLLFISAGLIAHGIVEFQGAGWIPTYIKPVFDVSHILSEKIGIGSFLKALFGYDANPSVLALIAYISFLTAVFWRWRKSF